jgi:hypothetical protein
MHQGTRAKLAGAIVPVAAVCLLSAGCSAVGNISGSGTPAGPSVHGTPASAEPASPAAAATASPSTPSPVPVLGQSRGTTQGYGSVRPNVISNGGDATGLVMNVSWQSWGGSQAVGTGTGYYVPPNVPLALAKAEQATVVAFDPGTCDGQYMYQAIEWYFPASGGSFDASTYLNDCSWTYHPSGGP